MKIQTYTMKKPVLVLSTLTCLFFGCKADPSILYTYRPPEHINDGLAVGSLDEVNIDPVLIESIVGSVRDGRYREVHSMLILKDDKLVLEEYFEGHRHRYDTTDHHGNRVAWDRTWLHHIMSVTKSITSVCIGIAIDEGFINSEHQSIFDYLPDYRHFNKHGKDKITIEHLLTMTSGLQWNEWSLPYGNLNNDVIMMALAEDPIAYVLNKPLVDEPGKSFTYAGGCNILLGEILRNATNMNIDEFSGKYLFDPLGIDPYYWAKYENGVVDAAGSIKITPRDMVKIGVTLLNDGIWKGKQIISEPWVEKSRTFYPGNRWLNNWDDHWGMRGYGYSWWTHQFVKSGKRIKMFYAAGWGGQYIMVIPEWHTVVVFTGGNYTSYRPPFEIFKKYILAAID